MRKLIYAICIIIIMWFVISTIEVWIHNASKGNEYSKYNIWVIISSHRTDMIVVDCQGKQNDTYEVTVEDIKGYYYAYYDSEPREIGNVIRITISGNEIINAR